jgi:hypothetical protein
VNVGTYVSYEDVRAYRGLAASETDDDALLRGLCRKASHDWDVTTRRHFWPLKATRYYDYLGSWRLVLGDDLLELLTFTNGDGLALVENTDFYLYPANAYPKARLDIRSDSSAVIQYDDTPQRALSISGIWGWHDDYGNAWEPTGDEVQDALGLTALATTVTVTDADGADQWGGIPRFKNDLLYRLENEYVLQTARDATTNVLTITRGVNGTTAATHAKGTPIYVYRPPAAIVHLVTRWVAYLYEQKDSGVYETSFQPGGGFVQVPAGIPKDVRMGIDQYRKRNIARG